MNGWPTLRAGAGRGGAGLGNRKPHTPERQGCGQRDLFRLQIPCRWREINRPQTSIALSSVHYTHTLCSQDEKQKHFIRVPSTSEPQRQGSEYLVKAGRGATAIRVPGGAPGGAPGGVSGRGSGADGRVLIRSHVAASTRSQKARDSCVCWLVFGMRWHYCSFAVVTPR